MNLYSTTEKFTLTLKRFIMAWFYEKKNDKNSKYLFITLQSARGQSFLEKFGLPKDDFDFVVYIKGVRYYLKSSAILHTVNELGGIWKSFIILIIVPGFIRDFIYKIIAKSRYRIFGREDSCIN